MDAESIRSEVAFRFSRSSGPGRPARAEELDEGRGAVRRRGLGGADRGRAPARAREARTGRPGGGTGRALAAPKPRARDRPHRRAAARGDEGPPQANGDRADEGVARNAGSTRRSGAGRRSGSAGTPATSVARARRLLPAALPAVVGLSLTVLHWAAGRRLHGLWIVPDEPIHAMPAIALWYDGPLPLLHGAGAGYGLLYPLVAGLPLCTGSTATGYASLKLLQALVVSLAAVPVFFLRTAGDARGLRAPCRRPRRRIAAAALFRARDDRGAVLPGRRAHAAGRCTRSRNGAPARSGSRARADCRRGADSNPGDALSLQIFAAAIVVDAALARDRSRSSRLLADLAGARRRRESRRLVAPRGRRRISGTLRGLYPLGQPCGSPTSNLAYIALSTGVVPFAALVLLVLGAIRGRERDPEARRAARRDPVLTARPRRYRWLLRSPLLTASARARPRCAATAPLSRIRALALTRRVAAALPVPWSRSVFLAGPARAVERPGRAGGVCRTPWVC